MNIKLMDPSHRSYLSSFCFVVQPRCSDLFHFRSPSRLQVHRLSSTSSADQTARIPSSLTVSCSSSSQPARISAAIIATAISTSLLFTSGPPACAYGLFQGRLEPCKGDSSCVSTTSVANPSKFGAPWTFEPQTSDPSEAWESLKAAILKNAGGGTIVECVNGPKTFYLRAEYPPSGFAAVLDRENIDDVEFRMIPEERLMTYRSASRKVFYLYPLQRPIDIGRNRARLENIRQQLGWVELEGQNLY